MIHLAGLKNNLFSDGALDLRSLDFIDFFPLLKAMSTFTYNNAFLDLISGPFFSDLIFDIMGEKY